MEGELKFNEKTLFLGEQDYKKFWEFTIQDLTPFPFLIPPSMKDVTATFEVQKSFIEGVQVKVVNASKEAQNLFTDTQEKSNVALEEFFAQAQPKAKAKAAK